MPEYTLQRHENGVYYVHWTEGRRTKRVSTRSESLGAAQAFLGQWKALQEQGEPEERVTIAQLWELKHGKAKLASTAERLRYASKILMPIFGHMHPSEINQGHVDDYIEARERGAIGRGACQGTIRFELAVLISAMNHGVRKRKISQADLPVLDPLPEASPARDRWLRTEEIEAIMKAAEEIRLASATPDRLTRAERFLALALYTAARRTAILELTWSQVHLDMGIIDYLKEGQQQTKKRKASVPISAALRPVLERAYAERHPGVSGYVLDHPGRIYDELNRILDKAGVKGVTPHVLRHTAATHMAKNGVSLWLIAKILGNTLDVVERTYAKFSPDFGREAVEAIPSFVSVKSDLAQVVHGQ